VNIVGLEHRVRVAVPDHCDVDVVGGAAASQHGVELLPRLLTSDDAMHGVGGDTLCSVHGCGVAEFHRSCDVVVGQGDDAAVPYVPHPHTTITGQVKDDPPVTVLHPVRCGDTKPAVIPTGDDQVPDAGRVAIGQLDVLPWSRTGEAVILSALVEPADQLPGRRQHDRVEAVAAVGLPAVEDGIEGGSGVSDVDASPVQVEAERFGSAVAEGQGGGGLGWIGEPVQLAQPDRAVASFNISEYSAGADRC
jgi:hypothetical protein